MPSGMPPERGGGGGQQALPRFWHSCKTGGRGKKQLFFAILVAEPIFAQGMAPKIIFVAPLTHVWLCGSVYVGRGRVGSFVGEWNACPTAYNCSGLPSWHALPCPR